MRLLACAGDQMQKEQKGRADPMRSVLMSMASALAILSFANAPAFADTVLDPLGGYCAGTGQCADNGTNSPTSTNPPVNFGFTISSGPKTGDFLVDFLVPNNEALPANYAITGTLSGTATKVSSTAFASGVFGLGTNPTLSDYLNKIPTSPDPNPASPDNNLNNYLGATQALDPGATGYFVYQADLGTATLLSPSDPNSSPVLNILGQQLDLGEFIVGFQNIGSLDAPDWVATQNSAAIFETTPPTNHVPEPATLGLFGIGLAATGWLRRRRNA